MTIGEKIRVLIARKKMSVTALASALGITRQYLTAKLRNNNFTLAELERIAKIIGCEFSYEFTLQNGEKF